LKTDGDGAEVMRLMSDGSSFHRWAAKTEIARSLTVTRQNVGTARQ